MVAFSFIALLLITVPFLALGGFAFFKGGAITKMFVIIFTSPFVLLLMAFFVTYIGSRMV